MLKRFQHYRHNGGAKCKSVASTGNGAKGVVRIAKRVTAGNLKHFPKKGRCNMKKTRQYYRCGKREPSTKCPSPRAITAQEALTLLESAISYCQSAGLTVSALNGDNGTLGLFVRGAHFLLTDSGTHAAFRLGVMSANDEQLESANVDVQVTEQGS